MCHHKLTYKIRCFNFKVRLLLLFCLVEIRNIRQKNMIYDIKEEGVGVKTRLYYIWNKMEKQCGFCHLKEKYYLD